MLYISHNFFIHSPINRNVGYLHVLDMFACIVNNATMNKGVQMYFGVSVFIFFGDIYIYIYRERERQREREREREASLVAQMVGHPLAMWETWVGKIP